MNKNLELFTVENFKFSIFDPVPIPERDTAYILYKEGKDMDKALVITERQPVLARQLRRGGFDRKVTVCLAWRDLQVKRKVLEGTSDFKFVIDIFLTYRVRDAKYVFANKVNIEKVVNDAAYRGIWGDQKKFKSNNEQEVGKEIRDNILGQLKAVDYLEIKECHILVDVKK